MTVTIRAVPAAQTLGSGVNINASKPSQPYSRASYGAEFGCSQIVERLEEAGATLLALPASGYSTHMRQMRFDIVHTALEAYGWEAPALRPATPPAAAITAMDEAFGWLAFIPEQNFVLRRIVGARALVHPLTRRHLFPWRRLAATLGADHKSVQRWHANGVAMILTSLRG